MQLWIALKIYYQMLENCLLFIPEIELRTDIVKKMMKYLIDVNQKHLADWIVVIVEFYRIPFASAFLPPFIQKTF